MPKALSLTTSVARPPAVAAKRVVVLDPENGSVIFQKNANVQEQVASTQKLLTALVVSDSGNEKGLVEIMKEDLDCMPMKCGLEVGDVVSRLDLLTVLLVGSANDAAQALARNHSGNLSDFSEAMNDLAARLGMKQSHFTNPHGLPDDRQFSTAHDMARLAMAVDAIPLLRGMVSLPAFELRKNGGAPLSLTNTNRLLHTYAPCDGMKTGFTKRAGYCLISSGERFGRRRIVVMLNSTNDDLWRESEALLEWSFLQ